MLYVMARKSRTKSMALCALFIALMAVGSFIRIPAPIVPITLQAQIALLAGVCLGGTWGCISIVLYMLLGLIGAPIFAGGGGVSYVFQASFGYLLGFAVSAFVSGTIARRGVITRKKIALALSVGLLITYVIGTAYAALILTVYLKQNIVMTKFLAGFVLMTLPKDVLLTALSVPLAKRMISYTV